VIITIGTLSIPSVTKFDEIDPWKKKNFMSLAPGEVQDDELIPETRSSLDADPQVDQHLETVIDR
jgi:hypothetical protein